MHIKATVSYFLRETESSTEVLLYPRLKGDMQGFLIGSGGQRERDETSQETAARETGEETHLIVRPEDIEEAGALTFHIAGSGKTWYVMLSRVRRWSGSPDCKPDSGLGPYESYSIDALPAGRFAPGDLMWLPRVLQGLPVGGTFWYGNDCRELLHYRLDF